ncbi:chloramphenicol phosphotransferase CPT family protein [Mesorhizobium qingshengii]|uniref:Chloramphenicol 3-O phosphotransferase n=1 Tax=Mesorhizobium qingshengii TaxID=1165689 RepID=A0A1G5V1R5_9HYPH|nr:chloramphenicol phosphotransferase [Mesorhizobium qingshengii]SDA39821.1 chloramphenicol 3-O phosphotransferase [Mesorhizobium qingshengii]
MGGQIIILNGAPRSGKSSIVQAIQENFEGVWMNLGVDVYEQVMPLRSRPGIGLRPGGERPDLESLVPGFYAALYESIAAHSRLGLNVVVDVGHHDAYSRPLGCLADCARRLIGLPVLFVGVRCPIEIIMERRAASATGKGYVTGTPRDPVPLPVRLWQEEVHRPGVYDLEVDTSLVNSEQCADFIRLRLEQGIARPSAIEQLAGTAIG